MRAARSYIAIFFAALIGIQLAGLTGRLIDLDFDRAAAATAPPPQAGCAGRNFIQAAPASLAVNDACLPIQAKGDGREAPAQFHMLSGSNILRIDHAASIDVVVTNTAGTKTLAISPPIARQDWTSATGVAYTITVPGIGGSATITATGSSANVVNVASGGTSLVGGELVVDTTNPANIPVGTVVVSSTSGAITLSNNVTVAAGDVLTYYATVNAGISAVSADGGTITLVPNTTNGLIAVPLTLSVQPTALAVTAGENQSTVSNGTWAMWRYAKCSIAAGAATLICPTIAMQRSFDAGTFSPDRDRTLQTSVASQNALRTTVILKDPNGACPDQVAQILTATATAAVLDRKATCALDGTRAVSVYWGEELATAAYNGSLAISPGQYIEVPAVGGGSTQTAPVPLLTTISSVADPFTIGLAANASITPAQLPVGGRLKWGTDDYPAVIAAANLIASNSYPTYRYLYWPPGVNTFMASVTGAVQQVDGLFSVVRCGEGRIVWPTTTNWLLNTSSCSGGPQWVAARGAGASQVLKQARAATGAGVATFGIVADSWLVPQSCQSSAGACVPYWLEHSIRQQNLSKIPNLRWWAQGGATLGMLDPNGPNYGNGSGITNATCGVRADWWQANCAQQWMTFLQGASPAIDSLVMRLGTNDGYNLPLGSYLNVVATTQSAAYRAAAGRNPDLVMAISSNTAYGPSGYQLNGTNSWYGQLAVAGLQRSMVRSGWFNSTMANGGSVGMVDLDAATHAAEEGWDPTRLPMRFALELLGNIRSGVQNAPTNLPYTFQSPVWGYGIFDQIKQTGSLSIGTFYSNIGGGRCYGAGNGAAFTPASAGSQTGNPIGYPGGAFCVDYDSDTTHWQINRYLYRFVQSGFTCAFTAAANSILVCTAAIANQGHEGASVWICGTGIGSSTAPAFMGSPSDCVNGTIKAGGVSSDGKTLTLTANLGATQAQQGGISVMFYLLQPGDPTDTGCTPTTVQSGGNTFQASQFYLHANGDVGITENIANVNSAFQEQGSRCQWEGTMAGFFENPYNPTLFTEDNAAHNGAWAFGPSQTTANTQGFQQYPPAWIELPQDSRITPLLTTPESWGLTGDYGPFGGFGNQHTGGYGAATIYSRAFDAADWNTVP